MLYASKEDWKAHLQNEHRGADYWVCFACAHNRQTSASPTLEQFNDEKSFEKHVLDNHNNTVEESHVRAILSACKRSAPVDVTSCPLCLFPTQQEDPVDRWALVDHIAECVHDFSLRALPWPPDSRDPDVPMVQTSIGRQRVYETTQGTVTRVDYSGHELSNSGKYTTTEEYTKVLLLVGDPASVSLHTTGDIAEMERRTYPGRPKAPHLGDAMHRVSRWLVDQGFEIPGGYVPWNRSWSPELGTEIGETGVGVQEFLTNSMAHQNTDKQAEPPEPWESRLREARRLIRAHANDLDESFASHEYFAEETGSFSGAQSDPISSRHSSQLSLVEFSDNEDERVPGLRPTVEQFALPARMRLLEIDSDGESILMKDFVSDNVPQQYAILSHTWGAYAEEVTFQDVTNGTGRSKIGYQKLKFCGEQARRDGLSYFWVDTCCINKHDNVELSEAILSMFRLYANAAKCYAYLSDVSRPLNGQNPGNWVLDFRNSRWFTRGWTLQELLAPASVEFFSREGEKLGSKRSLEQHICDVTGIPAIALRGSPLSNFTFTERLSWQTSRQTMLEEDKAYSMLGICDVFMPPLYGEGKESAFRRLRNKIDNSIKGKSRFFPPVANTKKLSLTKLRLSSSGLLGGFQFIQRRRNRTLPRSRSGA